MFMYVHVVPSLDKYEEGGVGAKTKLKLLHHPPTLKSLFGGGRGVH